MLLGVAGLCVLSFLFCSHFLYSSIVVLGRSMSPTLVDGDRRLVNCWAPRCFGLNRGDIVVLRDPVTAEKVVKRIVALPGETIQVRRGCVYINGARLREPYVPPHVYSYSSQVGNRPVRLKTSEYFVMGDNRPLSLDSRTYGPVRQKNIEGVVTN